MIFRLPVGCSTTELQGTRGELGHVLGSYVTGVLYTARISNVESLRCGERKKKLVNVKLGR